MKQITILTLFPNIFKELKNFSIIKRAIDKNKILIKVINFRKFATNKHKTIDDYQYGGGAGMVIGIEPIVKAIKKYRNKNSLVILLSPQGKIFTQKIAKDICNIKKDIILVCGHYEGFDARIINYVDMILSIGNYILSGGEFPAMVIIDAITRLIDGVINKQSLLNESFNNNLLDYDAYTKPICFEGYHVPNVLLSGNHKLINEFRNKNRLLKTQKYRPDLLKK